MSRPQPGKPSASLSEPLLRAVPAAFQRILHVGCGDGRLGAALKAQDPRRQVFGVERDPAAAARARSCLDQVYATDAAEADLPLASRSLDCILYGNVLGQVADPRALFRRHRPLLRPEGCVLSYVANAQHHAVVSALCTGDFPYAAGHPPEDVSRHFFTRSGLFKALLDAGFVPSVVEIVTRPCPSAWWEAVQPLVRHLQLDTERLHRAFDTYRFLVRGDVRAAPAEALESCPEVDHRTEPALSFVCCVADETTLAGNLLASPCFHRGSPHELLLMKGCRSAAAGLNAGLARARNPWIVCVHQDVYLPSGWPTQFSQQCRRAAQTCSPLGVCGLMGVSPEADGRRWQGRVIHQDRCMYGGPLPATTAILDELLLAFPRGTPLRLEPALGFHLYGADVCLAARRLALSVVALDALCYHNTRRNSFPPDFADSARVFVRKWSAALPVVTPCVSIGGDGTVSYK